MRVHLVDGTWELFRAFYGAPAARAGGREVGATRGIMRSLLSLLREDGVTHVACAFDTVIESFRNDLYEGYKTGDGVPDELMSQFPLAERATEALGIVTWRMVEFEADDALATFAARAADSPEVEQVVICSPDKDLTQCVRGTRVVCLDRMRRRVMDESGVVEKFGVPPSAIPDWLALVGDTSDGYPGVPRWGAKSAAALLAACGTLDAIPDQAARWSVAVRGAESLARSLREHRADALLYRRLATLRIDVPLMESLDDLRWRGARRDDFVDLCREIDDMELVSRIERWQD
ncbi:MAG TPA: 5'-3' exonuclease H3TH domain-containing protein [Gemmatimonadaceae bacterium]